MDPEGKLLLMQHKNFHCWEVHYDKLNNMLQIWFKLLECFSPECISREKGQKDQKIWLRRQQRSQGNSGKTSQENHKDETPAETDWAVNNEIMLSCLSPAVLLLIPFVANKSALCFPEVVIRHKKNSKATFV